MVDPADRRTNLESVIQTAIDSALKEVHTCLPAVVNKVDNINQLIDAQITIKRKLSNQLVNLPLLVNIPIRFPKSTTFSITFPIEVGDHVLILFSERSIDTWLTQGGIQDPFDIRKFSLSDAFAIPSMYPQTDLIPNFNTNDLEIKTNSGDTKVIIKKSEEVEIITTGGVDITTPLATITGNLEVTGQITTPTVIAQNSLTVNGKEMDQHTHPQGNDSSGDSEVDTGPPI